jgi:hypothetical protein
MDSSSDSHQLKPFPQSSSNPNLTVSSESSHSPKIQRNPSPTSPYKTLQLSPPSKKRSEETQKEKETSSSKHRRNHSLTLKPSSRRRKSDIPFIRISNNEVTYKFISIYQIAKVLSSLTKTLNSQETLFQTKSNI